MAEHQNSYKLLFSHALMVEDLLKGFVQEEWVRELDFTTLEKISESYVTDDIRDREDDIVWRVRWGKEWIYIYLLIEFQSTVDQWMAVRMMTYVGLLYQDLIRTGKLSGKKKLPPIFPIVLYNGKTSWNAATDINELVEEVPGSLRRYQPAIALSAVGGKKFSGSGAEAAQESGRRSFSARNQSGTGAPRLCSRKPAGVAQRLETGIVAPSLYGMISPGTLCRQTDTGNTWPFK